MLQKEQTESEGKVVWANCVPVAWVSLKPSEVVPNLTLGARFSTEHALSMWFVQLATSLVSSLRQCLFSCSLEEMALPPGTGMVAGKITSIEQSCAASTFASKHIYYYQLQHNLSMDISFGSIMSTRG